MLIKSLTLQNFRSYGEEPTRIEFDRGILLFEGDIGSGKSSILYGIEFALFGLGEVEGKHILRGSAQSAKVELEFHVGESDYRVVRTIERKRGAKALLQTRGWISERDGGEEELSPTELKTRILQILHFREKPGKSSSRIFRFAIFTPQELMRQVLSQRPEERIETLRRAFGIEDYSFAVANSEIVVRQFRRLAEVLVELSRELPKREAELNSLQAEIQNDKKELAIAMQEFDALTIEIESLKRVFSTLEQEKNRALSLQTLIPELEKGLAETRSTLTQCRNQIDLFKLELNETIKAKLQADRLELEYLKYQDRKKRLRELDGPQQEFLTIEKTIADLSKKVSMKETNLKTLLEAGLESKAKIKERISEIEESSRNSRILESKLKNLEEIASRATAIQKNLDALNFQLGELRSRRKAALAAVNESVSQLKELDGLSLYGLCPLCKQKLDKEHLRQVTLQFDSKLAAAREEVLVTDTSIMKMEGEAGELYRALGYTQVARQEREKISSSLARLDESRRHRDSSLAELAEIENKIQSSESQLRTREFARDEENRILSLRTRRESLSGVIEEYSNLRAEINQVESSGLEKSYLTAKTKSATEAAMRETISREESKASQLELLVASKSRDLANRREELEQAEPAIVSYGKLRGELDSAETRSIDIKGRVDRHSANLEKERPQLAKLQNEVQELRQKASKGKLYRGYATWLEGQFTPAVVDIETHVLDSINEEFKRVFHRWFSILVEDPNISVTVDDRFTPEIEQSGYELDAESLSGGERTAVALAYRLALNFMVKRANESLQTNLLILDEPTEGFSKEQIYRLRAVLEELECDQIILVSHERDLEALADKIYRVEKVEGKTQVAMLS